ncbi:MAG: FprA family A-type flavoprotein [Eubacteriales bacterium]|nr:FprA family A-type flavoprotein [Eubacteriales bacterium]
MVNTQKVTDDIIWIGGSERRLSRFENLFPLPNGVSYNSYVVLDEKTALLDTADLSVAGQFMENLEAALQGRDLDYMVIHHMEPDHCSLIADVMKRYPQATLVGNVRTFAFLLQFFPELESAAKLEIKEGDVLSTGKHNFHFVFAPFVHWPEVMVSYDDATKTLFSADAFGTFGSVDGSIFADEHDFEREYLDDARRYYANIVGKYGPQTLAILQKASGLDIQMICPLHGPVWRKDLGWFIDKYQKWGSGTPESDDILLFYASIYGHTASAAQTLAASLQAKSGKKVVVYDVSETDVSFLIGEIWRCGKIVLMCPTYNAGIYPKMKDLIADMEALAVHDRTFALAENGTWGPVTVKLMRDRLSALKNCTILEQTLTIRSALHEKDREALENFAQAIAEA